MPVSRERRSGVSWRSFCWCWPLRWPSGPGGAFGLFDAFYRSGALVFGGGHVVLPLLHDAVVAPGWVSDSAFLAGYGAAQAVPDRCSPSPPISARSRTCRRAASPGPRWRSWRSSCRGFLLLMGVLPIWDALRRRASAQAAMRGVNAAVVGLLGAALYDPVWTGSVHATG